MPIVVPPVVSGPGAIVDYASLLTAIAGWGHRDDLTASIPTFVQLAEAELSDKLILKDMESDEPLTLTTGRNYVALPTGFISPIAFWIVVSTVRIPLTFAMPQELAYYTINSLPRYVAVDGANLRFECPVQSNYSAYLRCIKTSNLSVSNTTNALLLHRPDIYLFGGLKQMAIYSKDPALTNYIGLFDEAVRQLKASDNRSKGIVHLRSDVGVRRRSHILTGDS